MSFASALGEAKHISVSTDTTLADNDSVAGHHRSQRLSCRERYIERPKVSVVDADELRSERQRALELDGVVDLY
jgi:hypothetical protein